MQARDIFMGPAGLRAGWRLLIFLGLVVALQAGFQGIVILILRARRVVVPEGLNAMVFLLADTITLIGVLIVSWIMAKWERRKLADYGLPGMNAFGWKFWEGVLFGFAGVSLLILLIFLAGGYSPAPWRFMARRCCGPLCSGCWLRAPSDLRKSICSAAIPNSFWRNPCVSGPRHS